MLVRAVHCITNVADVAYIVVVAPQGRLDDFQALLGGFVASGADITVVAGGDERTHSVRNGLAAMPKGVEVVLVHDAARALTPPAVFDRVITAVRAGALGVVPVLPVVDTIKSVRGPEHDEIKGTVDRSTLRAVQTPQGFEAAVLQSVYAQDIRVTTDDAGLLEMAGYSVRAVPGDARAMKVTTPHDLAVAALFL